MRSKSAKPSVYSPCPFHTIRFIAFLSAFVVAIILAVFIYNLQQKGYKLPWAFLILIITAVLSITNFTLTTIIHCSYGLSPRVSLTFNGLLFILWAISLGLLSYSVAHTILTSCTKIYWGTATGINVCRVYKALFGFTAAGTGSAIAAVWLDVIARQRQTSFGEYDPMGSNPAFGDGKLEDRKSVMSSRGVRHGDDAFIDVPDPDPIYEVQRAQTGGKRELLEEYRGGRDVPRGHDRDYYYGEEPGRGQHSGYGAGHGYAAYPGYSHVPQTAYDAGAYR